VQFPLSVSVRVYITCLFVIYKLLSPRSDGKPEAANAVVVAPDDGHEDARNMISCI